ncbi:MAG TPA: methyl-accepting chemotaxis protein, partial [Methylovirgula sp.]|nr:methyl-accepting chemotaxis protein [Methylovirgula sp.]
MFLNRWKLGPKIYLVVTLLALVTAIIGSLGIDAMLTYNKKVGEIDRASRRAIIGERVNSLIYAVVMDSRGIYMSATTKDSELYAPLVEQNLIRIAGLMKQWTALTEPEDQAVMERANARIDEFIRFRTELVHLSRQATLPEARAFGDNTANHTNRAGLNREISTLAATNDTRIDRLKREIANFYQWRMWVLTTSTIVVVLASLILSIFFVRSFLTRPLGQIVDAIKKLAAGDITGEVPNGRGDEIGDMAKAVRTFQRQAGAADALTAQVTEDVGRIALAAGQASSAVSQVSDGSNVQL